MCIRDRVYAECKARQNKRVFAIKGKGGDGIPYTAPPSKVKIVIDGKDVYKRQAIGRLNCWRTTRKWARAASCS